MRTIAGLAALALLAYAAPALGHAALLGSDPAEGAVLAQAPSEIALTFNEPVTLLRLLLAAGSGAAKELTQIHSEGNRVVGRLPVGAGGGTYLVSWRVVSADAHSVGGSLSFSIGEPTADAARAQETSDPRVSFLLWAAGALFLGGLLFGVGGVFFIACIAPTARPRPAVFDTMVALIVGMAAGLIALGAQGADMLGEPLSALAGVEPWLVALLSGYGMAWIVGETSLAVAAGALIMRSRRAFAFLSAAALVGVGLALCSSGHASDAPLLGLTRPAAFLHAVGATAWAGALIPLAALFVRRDPTAGMVLKRFSTAIPFFVVPLVAAGAVLAARELTRVEDLWTTAYGTVLSAKLAVATGLFALAMLNRYWLTRPAITDRANRAPALVMSIRAEWALIVVIVALVAQWRFTPPPRALLAQAGVGLAAGYAALASRDGTALASVDFLPGRRGANNVLIELTDEAGNPLEVQAVSLALSNPAAGIEPIRRVAARSNDDRWRVSGIIIPTSGTWKVALSVLISEFDETDLGAEVAIWP